MEHEYTCVYNITRSDFCDEPGLAVACMDKNTLSIHYGMKIFKGENAGVFVDSTRLTDIRNEWLKHRDRLHGKMNAMPRMDDDKVNDPVVMIPWQYACEFETTDTGSKIISMVYHALNQIDDDEFNMMLNDEPFE